MRKLILGIDALDYDIVKGLHLKGLQQQQYGKIKVPINKETNQPASPEVWASFLTGEICTDMRLEGEGTKWRITKLLTSLRKVIPVGFGLAKNLATVRHFPKLNKETFLDKPNVKAINSPFYNYDNKTLELAYRLSKGAPLKRLREDLYSLFAERRKEFISEIKSSDAEVVFAYMHILDTFQHLFYPDKKGIGNFYHRIDGFISFLKTMIPSDVHVLIVSDHGFNLEIGKHSHFGFYSSNRKLQSIPTHITDFYNIIVGCT